MAAEEMVSSLQEIERQDATAQAMTQVAENTKQPGDDVELGRRADLGDVQTVAWPPRRWSPLSRRSSGR
ncbi:hypothetical protein CTI14_66610, partial [Methylobacterium radiotolerans]